MATTNPEIKTKEQKKKKNNNKNHSIPPITNPSNHKNSII